MAQQQTTAIDALGALTSELAATRVTIGELPTRGEVDLRIAQEKRDRRRGHRQVMALLALVIAGVGLTAWGVMTTNEVAEETHQIAEDLVELNETNRQLNTATLEVAILIECVVQAAAATTAGPELQEAYGRCIETAPDRVREVERNGTRNGDGDGQDG